MKIDYDKEEKIIVEAIMHAREIQEYIWQELSYHNKEFLPNLEVWHQIFQKRVDKIKAIDASHWNAKVELRKRLLQQAALSILALKLIEDEPQN